MREYAFEDARLQAGEAKQTCVAVTLSSLLRVVQGSFSSTLMQASGI